MDKIKITTGDGVTVREFGRQIGKSHVWVLKLIESGTLPRNADGTIPLGDGLKAFADYVAAPKKPKGRPKTSTKKEEAQPTRERGRPRKEKPAPTDKRKPGRPRKMPPVELPIDDIPDDESPIASDESEKILAGKDTAVKSAVQANQAKAIETVYKAKLRQLEFQTKTEQLLDKAEVAKEAQWLAEQVKSKLMAIPPRISTLCEGRVSREIEEIISDAINDALRELQKCKYTGEQK